MLNRFRLISKLNCHAAVCLENAESQACALQTRWRKRRWAPAMMEKKLNPRIIIRLPEDQWTFLRDHYAKYRSKMRSIRIMWRHECIKQQIDEQSLSKLDNTDTTKVSDELLSLNASWNAATATIRNARMTKEAEQMEEERLQTIIQIEEAAKEFEDQARQMVLEEKEAASKFINVDNLEEEIERALNMRVNYNFAIDSSGSKYIELEDGSIIPESEFDNTDNADTKEALKS